MAALTAAAAWTAIGVGALAGILVLCAIKCVICALGFRSGGVAAESCASGIQSCIGNVAEGSLFARCQSWGAVGCCGAVYLVAAIVGAGLGYYAASSHAAAQ